MNRIQRISETIESNRLKLQMGLSPETDIDALTLRAMWHRLCRERPHPAPIRPAGIRPAGAG